MFCIIRDSKIYAKNAQLIDLIMLILKPINNSDVFMAPSNFRHRQFWSKARPDTEREPQDIDI